MHHPCYKRYIAKTKAFKYVNQTSTGCTDHHIKELLIGICAYWSSLFQSLFKRYTNDFDSEDTYIYILYPKIIEYPQIWQIFHTLLECAIHIWNVSIIHVIIENGSPAWPLVQHLNLVSVRLIFPYISVAYGYGLRLPTNPHCNFRIHCHFNHPESQSSQNSLLVQTKLLLHANSHIYPITWNSVWKYSQPYQAYQLVVLFKHIHYIIYSIPLPVKVSAFCYNYPI